MAENEPRLLKASENNSIEMPQPTKTATTTTSLTKGIKKDKSSSSSSMSKLASFKDSVVKGMKKLSKKIREKSSSNKIDENKSA